MSTRVHNDLKKCYLEKKRLPFFFILDYHDNNGNLIIITIEGRSQYRDRVEPLFVSESKVFFMLLLIKG